ncbi:hypothetical protein HanRHA438_Chr13g0615121 [Helianthus annuus]|nr:hypothetical protein HanRHA438_Chr13g0615121 [Helianthus annuus]
MHTDPTQTLSCSTSFLRSMGSYLYKQQYALYKAFMIYNTNQQMGKLYRKLLKKKKKKKKT